MLIGNRTKAFVNANNVEQQKRQNYLHIHAQVFIDYLPICLFSAFYNQLCNKEPNIILFCFRSFISIFL
jgi:hypothetical protein